MKPGTSLTVFFLAFNISFIPRGENYVADSLATSASNFKIPLPPKLRYDTEVKYKPVGISTHFLSTF